MDDIVLLFALEGLSRICTEICTALLRSIWPRFSFPRVLISYFCHRSANVFEVWNTERDNIHFAIVVMQRVVFFAFAVAVV